MTDTETLPAVVTRGDVMTMEADNSTSIAEVISRAARDPSVDVDKMERLLAMQERILAKQAESQFNLSMQQAQQQLPAITRDATNDHTRSRYTRLETLLQSITPIYTANGFSLSFGTADSKLENHYRVTCKVSHVAGHSREYHCDIPADGVGAKGNANKTATHAFGSTMSYARRYLVLLIFNIALTNEDTDGPKPQSPRNGEAPQVTPRAQRSTIDIKREELGNAWQSKNPRNLGESDSDYRRRFKEWGNLALGKDSPDAQLVLNNEKDIERLLERLK